MADNLNVIPACSDDSGRSRSRAVIQATLNLALAGIGVVALFGDEAHALYRRRLARGRGDISKVRERLKSTRFPQDTSVQRAPKPSRRRESASDEWRAALERLNLPTATQVKVLTQQVADLEAKIEQLKADE